MNEEIILSMVKPYVKNNTLAYDDLENIFSVLSLQELDSVVEFLSRSGINLLEEKTQGNSLILDVDDSDLAEEDFEEEEFRIRYDESIFKDQGRDENCIDSLIVYKTVKQTNEVLCNLIQKGNRQAVQDLCVKNKKLVDKYVVAYAKRYGNRLDFEDLEQVGFMGLIKAAKKFNMKMGNAFSTYAVYWIKQSISREIMDNGYAIRIPVHMMERINRVVAANNRLAGEEISPSARIERISNELAMSEKNVRECLMYKNNFLSYSSLDTPIGEEGDAVLGEMVPTETTENVEAEVIRKMLREKLSIIMDDLTLRESEVVKMRFGWDDGRCLTLEEIGRKYGVTRERIRQIEEKAIRKLRNPVRSKTIKDFLED